MKHMTELIKNVIPFPPEAQTEFFQVVKALDLNPGEWIPDNLPSGTRFFVEDGFLLLTTRVKDEWKCSNFYPEGTTTVTYSEGAAESREGSFRGRATEPSQVYYILKTDEDQLKKILPGYSFAMSMLSQHSYQKHLERSQLFKLENIDRLICIDEYFPTSSAHQLMTCLNSLTLRMSWTDQYFSRFRQNGIQRSSNPPKSSTNPNQTTIKSI